MMLSLIRGLLGGRSQPPAENSPSTPAAGLGSKTAGAAGPRTAKRRRSLSLRAAGLGSAAQRRGLRSLGIKTTDDLLAADAGEIVRRLELSPAAAATVRRWQRAVRLARRFRAMTPLDALLLHAVHRGTRQRIATESAPRLHRDLERYAMSTAGSRLLGATQIPSAERVKRWVEAARRAV